MDEKIIQQVKQRYGIVGNYEGLNRSIDVAIQVAPTELSVLIYGESGVGKEVLPRVISSNACNSLRKVGEFRMPTGFSLCCMMRKSPIRC